jgi:hypothetical protein
VKEIEAWLAAGKPNREQWEKKYKTRY